MSDEHDDWFKQGFGFDLPEAAKALEGVQDRIVAIDLRPDRLPKIMTDPGGMKGEGGLGLPWMPESVPDFASEQGQAVVEGMGQPLVAGGAAVDAATSAMQDVADAAASATQDVVDAVTAPLEAAAGCAEDVIPDFGRPLEASAEAVESVEQAVEQLFESDPPAAPPAGGGAAGADAGAQAGGAGAAGAAAGAQAG